MIPAIKIVHNLSQDMAAEAMRINKCMGQAVKVTAFAARKDMQSKLKKGELDLAPLAPYKNLPRSKRRINKSGKIFYPLTSLSRGILYNFDQSKMTAELGFTGPEGAHWQRKYAEKHLRGYMININKSKRRNLINRGILLRKETQTAKVPPRDIIGHYLEKNQARMLQSIKEVFEIKMAGGRV